ncbi:MAG TPA: hypothetical protein VFB36_12255 [Nevskiaceae bacterium]|nr:hypothetical protein [Nevskiaceae bacterium]
MKALIHFMLAIGLLLQGELAVAKKSMPCCDEDRCACEAICSPAAIPVVATATQALPPQPATSAPKPAAARPPFRLTLLKPPIGHSA